MTIDWWTLAIQAVNVLILVWLLQHFFWRPVAAMIEQRRTTAQQILAEAQSKRAEAVAASAEIEHVRAGLSAERDAILAAAREAADQLRAARLDEAAKSAASMEAAARSAIAQEQKTADKAWASRSSLLAVDIARRLAGRLDGPLVQGVFLDWLIEEVRRLPESTRQGTASADISVDVVTPGPLDGAVQERYRREIGEALDGHSRIGFVVDPALIAGIELRGPHFLVSNSWQADLAHIMADIAHADKP